MSLPGSQWQEGVGSALVPGVASSSSCHSQPLVIPAQCWGWWPPLWPEHLQPWPGRGPRSGSPQLLCREAGGWGRGSCKALQARERQWTSKTTGGWVQTSARHAPALGLPCVDMWTNARRAWEGCA